MFSSFQWVGIPHSMCTFLISLVMMYMRLYMYIPYLVLMFYCICVYKQDIYPIQIEVLIWDKYAILFMLQCLIKATL